MNPLWLAFGCGIVLGVFVGALILGLCIAVRHGNDLEFCYCDEAEQGKKCSTCEKVLTCL